MKPLVVTGAIQHDESLPGYLIRLSHANGLRLQWLLERARLASAFEYHPASFELLAHLGRSDLGALQQASLVLSDDAKRHQFGRSQIGRPHLLTDGARVCPACLDERGYVDRLWHLRGYAACHHHLTMLVDQCTSCRKSVSWRRRRLDRCDCGQAFDAGQAAPDGALDVAVRLALATSNEVEAQPRQSLSDLLTVSWFFGCSGIADPRRRGAVSRSAASIATSIEVLQHGAPFVTDWRGSFDRWAHDRFQAQGGRVGLHRDFGHELARLRSTFAEACPFVIDEVREYFSLHWQGYLLRRKSYFCIGPKVVRFVTSSEAARTLGVRIPRIWEMVEAGQLAATKRSAGSRTYRVIRAEGVETLRRHFAALLTPTEAAGVLGISLARFRSLERAGHFKAEQVISQTKRFSPKALRDFCVGLAGPSRAPAQTHLRITEVFGHRVVDLVADIAAGRLSAWFGAAGFTTLADLHVDASDVEALRGPIGRRKLREMVSAKDATARLQVNHPTLSALVTRQGISAERTAHGHLLAVPKEAVDEWGRDLVTSASLAKPFGLAPASVARRLKQLGFTPCVAANPDKRIAALWSKAEVAAVDFSTQWRTSCGTLCARPPRRGMKRLKLRDGRSVPKGNVSLADLAKSTLIDRETLRRLAQSGHLQATLFNRAGHLRGVLRTSAEAFQKQYVSSSEIAKAHGLKAVAVTRRLKHLGLQPALESDGSARVQACWRRVDIRDLDFQSQYMLPCGRASAPSMLEGAHRLAKRPTGSPRLAAGAIYTHTASGILGTNSSSLRAAVEAGHVRAASRSATGKILTVIEDDVVAFAQRYVFTPKLAAELGLSVRNISRGLLRLGVEPVWAGRRPVHALWDRDAFDTEDLLQRWVTATGELSEQSSLF
jgi:hypothetical protein